eukprot:3307229-Rhodomonas_salina.1
MHSDALCAATAPRSAAAVCMRVRERESETVSEREAQCVSAWVSGSLRNDDTLVQCTAQDRHM